MPRKRNKRPLSEEVAYAYSHMTEDMTTDEILDLFEEYKRKTKIRETSGPARAGGTHDRGSLSNNPKQ